MATIVTRAGKGSPLTNNEVDDNFVNLNTELVAKVATIASADGSVTITGTTAIDLSVVKATNASNLLVPVRNATGATLTKGTAVYISGATGQISTVTKAIASGDSTSAQTLGLIAADLPNNTNGNVVLIGTLTGVNTAAYSDGQQLYLSPSVAGGLTATKPYAPDHLVYIAVVEYAHAVQGKLFVKVQNGYELDELHDVAAQSPTNGQTIVYNSTSGLWEKSTVSLTAGVNGTLPVANGGTGATTAPNARVSLGAAASGANTDITSVALTTGTISTTPTAGTDIVNKNYADSIAAGINFHQSVRLASAAALPAYTYNNGTAGVGATITGNANGALSLDGVAVAANDRVLIKNETSAAAPYNGVYVVTRPGNGSTTFLLTRSTDFNTAGSGVNQIDAGDFFLVTAGSTQANTSWVQQTALPITLGTTALVFTQFGAPITYSAGTGLTLGGTVFSITNTGVTANSYGSASSVPVIAVNAQGQITSASSSSIAIAASQITSGSLPIANGGTGATTAAGALSNLGAYAASNPAGYTTNVGTVTSVAALTLGTTGTDLSSSIANGTTTPVITLNVPTASASNRGALSSTDWSTFNGKQAALVSGSNIKTVNGTTLLGSGDLGTIGVAYGGTGATTAAGALSNLGAYAASNPAGYTTNVGTVTSVSGTGTVSGLTLTGSVTSSGSLTLGGTLSLTSGNVTTALGYTPYNATNPNGYITGINSGNVTTALGYTPANKAGDTFTGTVSSSADFRAPIFYDSNDTAYYVDPTGSTSAVFAGNIFINDTSWATDKALRFREGGTDTYGAYVKYSGLDYLELGTRDNSTTDTRAIYISRGANWAGSDGSFRAPIFYDSNNTAYYVDPAAATILGGWAKIDLTNGASPTEDGRGFVINGTYTNGQYSTRFRKWDDGGGLPLYIQQTTGTAGSWSNVASFGASNARFHFHVDGTGYSTSDWRAPIFYDSNNTGYYVDPSTTGISGMINGEMRFGGGGSSSVITSDGDFYSRRKSSTSTGVYYFADGGTKYIYWDGGRYYFGNAGPTDTDVSFRAPIFYDLNNTAYYGDFASTGTSLNLAGLIIGGSSASTNVNTANDTGSMSIRGSTTTVASVSFHRAGAYAINMGLGTDNVFRIGGWSASSNCFQMDGSGNLTMLGNVTAYSDARLKKDVVTVTNALDLVGKMRGVTYTRKDTGEAGVGVIAQEMLEVLPQVVQQGVGDDDTLSVAYGNIVGVLIEAIKELENKVKALEAKE